MDATIIDVCQRLSRVEVLLENHLQSHEKILWMILIPIGVGVAISILQNAWLTRTLKRNGNNSKKG